jgi:hypothetical protein
VQRTSALALGIAALVAAACTDPSLDQELSRDLALAASEAVELAPAGGGYAMSAAEVTPPVSTAKRSYAVKRPAPRIEPVTEPVSIEPSEIVAIAEVPEAVEAPVPTPAETDLPAPARRPAPIPVNYPVGGGDGGAGIGDVIGTVIGVVIRGGAVGDDDCDLHRRPGRGRGVNIGGVTGPIGIARGPAIRGGVAINDRLPRTIARFPR